MQGFIVALPTEWTRGEDNLFSKRHVATIAAVDVLASDTALAANEHSSAKESMA
ncbi:hypothetical protein [Chitinimonas taiwanensis]|uniref:hypothetical protein n=1 Tax=Chitinimonas taiwanensis TaxID=240412 RepID=UPI000A7171A2|nr:hypothetical protein [Chitinimonas taiwanensis]